MTQGLFGSIRLLEKTTRECTLHLMKRAHVSPTYQWNQRRCCSYCCRARESLDTIFLTLTTKTRTDFSNSSGKIRREKRVREHTVLHTRHKRNKLPELSLLLCARWQRLDLRDNRRLLLHDNSQFSYMTCARGSRVVCAAHVPSRNTTDFPNRSSPREQPSPYIYTYNAIGTTAHARGSIYKTHAAGVGHTRAQGKDCQKTKEREGGRYERHTTSIQSGQQKGR